MKSYRITVNGNVYDVTVEETGSSPSSAMPMSVPVATTAVPVVAPTTPKAATGSGAGKIKITAPMPGKILAIKTSVGATVKKGDVLMILEAMKMENEIPATEDGVVASIDITEGASVESGAVLASLN